MRRRSLKSGAAYLGLLAGVLTLTQNVQRDLVLVCFLENIIRVGNDLLRAYFQPSLFECLPLDRPKNILAKVEVASGKFV